MKKHLILSRIRTPDGTILTSYHQHDYVTHTDKNGETYMLDGGNEYQRYAICKEPFEDLSIWSDAPFEVIRENYYWFCSNIYGDKKPECNPISKLSNNKIKEIVKFNDLAKLSKSFLNYILLKEIRYRQRMEIFIED